LFSWFLVLGFKATEMKAFSQKFTLAFSVFLCVAVYCGLSFKLPQSLHTAGRLKQRKLTFQKNRLHLRALKLFKSNDEVQVPEAPPIDNTIKYPAKEIPVPDPFDFQLQENPIHLFHLHIQTKHYDIREMSIKFKETFEKLTNERLFQRDQLFQRFKSLVYRVVESHYITKDMLVEIYDLIVKLFYYCQLNLLKESHALQSFQCTSAEMMDANAEVKRAMKLFGLIHFIQKHLFQIYELQRNFFNSIFNVQDNPAYRAFLFKKNETETNNNNSNNTNNTNNGSIPLVSPRFTYSPFQFSWNDISLTYQENWKNFIEIFFYANANSAATLTMSKKKKNDLPNRSEEEESSYHYTDTHSYRIRKALLALRFPAEYNSLNAFFYEQVRLLLQDLMQFVEFHEARLRTAKKLPFMEKFIVDADHELYRNKNEFFSKIVL
jgi:hypothetical protein